MKRTFEIEEEDRQLIILALAITANFRPGFDHALSHVAEQLRGAGTFDDLKRCTADEVAGRLHSTERIAP